MAGCDVAYVSTLLTISRFESNFSDAIWGLVLIVMTSC